MTSNQAARDAEYRRRQELWDRLVSAGGPDDVPASLLKTLRLYGGMRGIWVDKEVTTTVVEGTGVTVSLFASEGGPYPGRYEYPQTRVPSWDEASIEATKNANRLQLPVFLVSRHVGSLRSVRRVAIDDSSDDERHFLLSEFDFTRQDTALESQELLADDEGRDVSTKPLRVPAIRIEQHRKVFYIAAVPASRLLEISKVDVWHSGAENPGYQRAPVATRKNQIARYLAQEDAVLPLGGLLNARRDGEGSRSVLEFKADGLRTGDGIIAGVLELPSPDQPLWIVDMQHRLGGFEVALQHGEDVADFPVVVTIADGMSRLEEIQQFELINTTQKKVRTDLARRLLEIRAEDINEKQLIVQQGKLWQARGPRVVDWLNINSPVWRGGITEPNATKKERPNGVAKETSFVTSLKPVLNTPLLSRAPEDQIAELLSWYWQVLAGMWKEAFADPKAYVVQKTPGLFDLHSIAPDVFELARQKGELNLKGIRSVLEDLDDIDSDFWHKANGTAGQFGSMKGFSILAEELRSALPMIDLSLE